VSRIFDIDAYLVGEMIYNGDVGHREIDMGTKSRTDPLVICISPKMLRTRVPSGSFSPSK
jgi:hypothetical protein